MKKRWRDRGRSRQRREGERERGRGGGREEGTKEYRRQRRDREHRARVPFFAGRRLNVHHNLRRHFVVLLPQASAIRHEARASQGALAMLRRCSARATGAHAVEGRGEGDNLPVNE